MTIRRSAVAAGKKIVDKFNLSPAVATILLLTEMTGTPIYLDGRPKGKIHLTNESILYSLLTSIVGFVAFKLLSFTRMQFTAGTDACITTSHTPATIADFPFVF